MSHRDQARIRRALSSRDSQITDATGRLSAAFGGSDAASIPPDNELAAASKSLRDNYRDVSDAVAQAGAGVPGSGTLVDGLADYSAAYGKLARGLQTSDQRTGDIAFNQMQALLQSAEQKVSRALGRLGL